MWGKKKKHKAINPIKRYKIQYNAMLRKDSSNNNNSKKKMNKSINLPTIHIKFFINLRLNIFPNI